ncbi:MAG TPA: thioredoxin family protein [Thermoanaerobaculia bacterium]
MIRRLVLLAAVAMTIVPQLYGGTWQKTVAAAQTQAKTKNQLILVDMFAEWCGWCHRFEREVFPSMAFQNATSDMVLLRLDTEDGGEGTQIARKFGITSLPTFLVLAPDLTIAGIIRGYSPPADFANMLKETRNKYAVFQKKVANEASFGKDFSARLDLAKEFISRAAYDKSEPRLKKLIAEKGIPVAIRDEAYYQLAVNYAVQNRNEDGLKTVRQLTALSKNGESVERARYLASQIYMQQGNLLGAANELRSFKAAFPNSPLIGNVDMMLPEIERRLAANSK